MRSKAYICEAGTRECFDVLCLMPVHISLYCIRRSTETSASSSSLWEQTVRIRPSVSAWGNIKVALALWWGQPRRAMSQLRPREW